MFWWCLRMMSRATAICDGEEKWGAVAVDEEPGKDGKAGGAKDGGQRDIAGERQNHEKDGDGRESGQGRGDEEDAKAGGHALASAKTQPDGKHVAENGAEGGQGLSVA